jgi:hypothetical protein
MWINYINFIFSTFKKGGAKTNFALHLKKYSKKGFKLTFGK